MLFPEILFERISNLIPLADQLGMDEVADTLEANLREEQAALDELSTLGEDFDYGQLSA